MIQKLFMAAAGMLSLTFANAQTASVVNTTADKATVASGTEKKRSGTYHNGVHGYLLQA